MQGASTVAVAFMLAAAVPAASSAQQAPGVGLPPVPQAPPALAPLPPISPPSAPAPATPAPSVPAPSGARAIRVPERTRGSAAERAAGASRPGGTGSAAPLGGSRPARDRLERRCPPGRRPAGRVSERERTDLAQGSPGGPCRRRRAGLSPRENPARRAGGSVLRGRKGVLGTSFRTRRRLVRALRGCIAALPQPQDRLLTLRYGVGDAQAHPAREVAGMLNLSPGQYAWCSAAPTGIGARAARAGGCGVGGGGGASAPPGYAASGPGGIGRALAAAAAASGSEQEAIGGLGGRPSGGAPPEGERRSGFGTPARAGRRRSGRSVIAALVLMAALAGLAPDRPETSCC